MRLFVWSMYLVLSVGAVTMVYPFVLMLSNSFASQYDNLEFEVFPDYLMDESVLFAKYIYEKLGLVPLAAEYGLSGVDPVLDGWVVDDESGEVLLGPESARAAVAGATPGGTRDGGLTVVHSMPDVSAVDVYADGRRIVEDLGYRSAVSVPLPSGNGTDAAIVVKAAGTETSIGRAVTAPFPPGTRSVIAVSGRPEDSWRPHIVRLLSGVPAAATGASIRVVNLLDRFPGMRVAFAEVAEATDSGEANPEGAVEVRVPQGNMLGQTSIIGGRYRVTLDARGVAFSALDASGEGVFRKGRGYTILAAGHDDGEWVVRTDIAPPEPLASWLRGEPGTPTVERAKVLTGEFDRFRKSVPDLWRYVYFQELFNRFDTYVMFQKWLQTQVTFEEVRDTWGMPVTGWNVVFPPGEDPYRHQFWPEDDQITRAWTKYKRDVLPVHYVQVLMLDSVYRYFLDHTPLRPDEEENIRTAAAYNGIFGTRYARFTDIRFPRSRPAAGRARELYDTFLREWCPATMVRLRAPAGAYREYLEDRYRTPEEYNTAHDGPAIVGFGEIDVPLEAPGTKVARADWQGFMAAKDENGEPVCDIDWIDVMSPEWTFQRQLREKYGTIARFNAACGTFYVSFDEVGFPAPLTDMVYFLENRGEIRKRFFSDNYVEVWNYIAGHGRAAWNTLILVVATIFTALTVNPMAAYALSRFRLKATNKILLFLLATMAFPAEVGMIPSFLLLKNFHMLNTYWALILPGVAGGFAIFLLKGFFDSLPPELYEAAIIDGAGEWTMFWRITLPLCKPILAVMALGAFGGAYGAFMFAFLVCQKPSMWTLMVFLYQFQQTAPQHVVMASLVIASIPTLLVFIFCQNIILRGIIVPSFK